MGWFTDSKKSLDRLNDPKAGVTTLTEVYHDSMYEGAVIGAQKISRGLFSLASSGFGKGLLAVAALALIGFPLGAGLAAAAELITVGGFVGEGTFVAAASQVPAAITTGLALGANLLFHPIGWMAMAMGGTLGAVYEVKTNNDQLSASRAMEEAALYAKLREQGERSQEPVQQQQPQPQPTLPPVATQAPATPDMPPPEQTAHTHVEREMARRTRRSADITLTQSL